MRCFTSFSSYPSTVLRAPLRIHTTMALQGVPGQRKAARSPQDDLAADPQSSEVMSIQVRFDLLEQLLLGHPTDERLHGVAVLENDHRRYATDPILGRRGGVGVHV